MPVSLAQISVKKCLAMTVHRFFQDYNLRRKGQVDDNLLQWPGQQMSSFLEIFHHL